MPTGNVVAITQSVDSVAENSRTLVRVLALLPDSLPEAILILDAARAALLEFRYPPGTIALTA